MAGLFSSKYLVLITLGVMALVRMWDPWPVESLRLRTFDAVMSYQDTKPSEELLIVDLGEPSMQQNGQWPWPRQTLAQLIEKLRQEGAAAIVLAVFFPEADRMGGDADLVQALGPDVVIAQTASTQTRVTSGRHVGSAQLGEDPRPYLSRWPGLIRSLDQIEAAAGGVGMTVIAPEVDGIVRRMPMLVVIGNGIYPSVALETLRVLAGDRSYQVITSQAGVEAVRIPQYGKIDTDSQSRVWIARNSIIPIVEASSGDLSQAQGRIAVVGLAAEGLNNPTPTPQGLVYPHHIQAQTLQSLIDGTNIQRPWYMDLVEIFCVIWVGLIMWWSVPRTSIVWSIPLLGMALSASVGLPLAVWWQWNWLADSSWLVLTVLLIYSHGIFNNFVREFRLKQQIKKQFGTYLSPALVEKLQKNPELLRLGGETRELSIMFTDVRGFTSISEHYGENVQGLTQIMNRYMTAMTAKILDNNGTLDKYIGDAQMAFWNAPLDNENHAKDALRTALTMLEDLKRFNDEIAQEGIPAFGMGLGINTGNVVVGNMGSDQRFDYTCLGDAVNLASRLEGQSKSYGVKLVLGPLTAQQVQDEFPVIELDWLAVKGKTEPVSIYTVLSKPDSITLSSHRYMLKLYRRGLWSQASEFITTNLKGKFNEELDGYYDMMLERMSEHPPEKFDGVYRASSK
jgi:adenylate cyclase